MAFQITVRQLADELHIATERVIAVALECGVTPVPTGATALSQDVEIAIRGELGFFLGGRGGECECCGLGPVPVSVSHGEDGARHFWCVACMPHGRVALMAPSRGILETHRGRRFVYESVDEDAFRRNVEPVLQAQAAQIEQLVRDKADLLARLADRVKLPPPVPEAVRMARARDEAMSVLVGVLGVHEVESGGKCTCGLAAGRCPTRKRLAPILDAMRRWQQEQVAQRSALAPAP